MTPRFTIEYGISAEAAVQLSVIVLNWNGRSWLERCVPSLLAEGSPNVRVYVADNGSVDGSLELLRTRWPQVQVVANGQNLRFAGGNNAAARIAIEHGCDILFFLNNDTEIVAGSLAHLIAEFAGQPRLGVAGPRITYLDRPDRIWFGGGIARPSWAHFAHRAIRKSVDAGADPAGPTDWVTGCAFAVRREVFEALGGLDESFYIYAEDVDFCLRAKALGWELRYQPRAQVRHAVSASVGGRRSAFKVYHQARARRQLVQRHVHGLGRASALLGCLVQDFAMVAWSLLRGEAGVAVAALQGFWDAGGTRNRYRVP